MSAQSNRGFLWQNKISLTWEWKVGILSGDSFWQPSLYPAKGGKKGFEILSESMVTLRAGYKINLFVFFTLGHTNRPGLKAVKFFVFKQKKTNKPEIMVY